MTKPEIDLIASKSGSVVAPAGCGKTQLIVDSLAANPGLTKPVLILTHTNAGVAALKNRLNLKGIPKSIYKISTIDGWAMRLVSMFPMSSLCPKDILEIRNPNSDYETIRDGALTILSSGVLNDLILSTYSKLLVDEYQDCQESQHLMVLRISEIIETCIVGDPLQAIFNFRNNKLINWNKAIEKFPIISELQTPWRWINAGANELGEWLISIRSDLMSGRKIDLSNCPKQIKWVDLSSSDVYSERLEAASLGPVVDGGRILVIGESTSPANQQTIASQTPGATTVESAEFKDLIKFSKNFDPLGGDALSEIAVFCSSFVTNIAPENFLRRVSSLKNGTARIEASDAESAALEFLKEPSLYQASVLLEALSETKGCRVYRPDIFRTAIDSLQLADQGDVNLYQAVVHYRDLNRNVGRNINRRSVGSTLLLKGLEADTVVILHPEKMDSQNLYVALTRGSNSIVICSNSRYLPVVEWGVDICK